MRSASRRALALCAAPLVALPLSAAASTASKTDPAIRALTEVADISGLTASPDGRWVAFRIERPSIAADRIDTSWYIAAADGAAPPRLLGKGGAASWDSAGVIRPARAQWMPDSRSLVVRLRDGQRTALWSLPVAGAPALLFAADSDIERFAVTGDGQIVAELAPRAAMVEQAEKEARDRGLLMDAAINLADSLLGGASSAGGIRSERWTGHWFESAPLLWDRPRRMIRLDPQTGARRPATASDAQLLLPAPPPVPPEKAVSAALAAPCRPAPAPCATSRLAAATPLDPARRRWLITIIDAGLGQHLYIWEAARTRLRLLRSSPGLLNGGRQEASSCAVTGAALFCVEATASQPPRLVRLPLGGGALRVVAEPNRQSAGGSLIAERLAWRVGSRSATGWLLHSHAPGKQPLFISYYRCTGYLRGGLGDEWPLRLMAATGIAVLCINALPLTDADAETRYEAGLAAIRAGVDLLERRGLVDRRRIGMGGLSFGSEVTFWVAAHSDLLRAASIASAQIEPTYYWFNSLADRGRFRQNFRRYWGLGSPDEDPARWARLAPAAKVASIDAPVLLQIPEKEARLSPELFAKLISARKGELHIFPFAPHIKVSPRQKHAAYARNLDWFRYWLQDHVDPDPAKTAQYKRWAALAPPGRDAASIARTQRSRSAISSSRK
ncbi:Atxe2 family lasso peptide isopeptidase [Sphingopyxis sp. MWB1]|uniref:Atxe2 family lasso peptide isopeptidase n=1 Tax=Sphingopyxis sp. MWB1 TaxID=1537715 RepID=UPI0013626A40|nr:Atxe2 family lasso peptide isopeptidase [Sphingopyxis sp. MWB1]